MKINLEYDDTLKDDQVVLKVSTGNPNSDILLTSLKSSKSNLMAGKLDEKTYLLELEDIESFFTCENGVSFYANGLQYRTNEKLFEIEKKYSGRDFMRISKSVIVNIKKVEYLAPSFNKKLIFKMDSGKVEYSSRTYYNSIKNKLGV